VEQAKKTKWLTTAAVLESLGQGTPRKLASKYRRELEEAAGLGEWETDWKDDVRAMLLVGSQDFVERVSRLLKGDRREHSMVLSRS
jgi:hypothetical protein